MCGIAGIIRFDDVEVSKTAIRDLIGGMAHRGPDGVGECLEGAIGLGFTRLAIIDVVGGQQPIFNEDRTVAIVCNGEIYNHAELRVGLEESGHVFRTHSDVEVVLHLYEESGDGCFTQLNGMFAVAIADFKNQRLTLARDPAGQKPLYLWQTDRFLAFSSELKTLAQMPEFLQDYSMASIVAYSAQGFVPAPLSVFEGVQKLLPGSSCIVERNGVRQTRPYWKLNLGPKSAEEVSDPGNIRNELIAAVSRHLMSERPLGVFLSGGLDSAAVVACMHLSGQRDIRTYTVGFEGYADNEFANAHRIASHFKTNHTELMIKPSELWDSLDFVAYAMDDPVPNATAMPLSRLCERAAKDNIVAVLIGEGSDELLAGYTGTERYMASFERIHRLRRQFGPLARLLVRLLPESRWRDKLAVLAGSDADYLISAIYRFDGMFDTVFRRRYGTALANSFDPLAQQARYFRERQDWDGMSLVLGASFERLADGLLQRADRIGMAYSLELRCPFLDTRFMDYCSRLPLDAKVRSGGAEPTRKIALKRAFRDILPDGIALQRKKGFAMPIFDWLTTHYRELVISALQRNDTLVAELLPEQVRMDVFQKAAAGDIKSKERLWLMVYLIRWADVWSKRRSEGEWAPGVLSVSKGFSSNTMSNHCMNPSSRVVPVKER